MGGTNPQVKSNVKKIVVLGSGNFGTCLAHHLAGQNHAVTLWTRDPHTEASINEKHRNPRYLTGLDIHPAIRASTRSDGLFDDVDMILLAVPTQGLRQVLELLADRIPEDPLIVCAVKGVENNTLTFPLGIVTETLGATRGEQAVVLSGPSFAVEVVEGQPTAVSLASNSKGRCRQAQSIFHSPYFRAYTSEDPVGLEVAGALKNVIAIASGATVGMGYQRNSQAALLTRGLAEITRVGIAVGANPLTFTGLGGVGDLFLTCTSEKSRNYTVGYRLGQGEQLGDIIRTVGSVAEGVTTAKAAWRLSRKLGVDAPIIGEVYRVLYEKKPIAEAVASLLTRDPKPEIQHGQKQDQADPS